MNRTHFIVLAAVIFYGLRIFAIKFDQMKNLLALFLLIGFAISTVAQDAAAPHQRKKFKMGFTIAPSVDWLGVSTPDVSLDAAHIKFQYGIVTEFAFANNYAFVTGLEHKLAGASVDFMKLPHYFTADGDTFNVDKRNYKMDYLNIPLTLKLMTNQIGYFTYFGKFGVDASFLVRGRADDEGAYYGDPNTNVDIDNRDIFEEISIFKIGLNVGAGAEWNFSGNTALVFGVSYHHGFIDVLRDPTEAGVSNDQMLATWSDSPANSVSAPFAQKANLQYVTLDVGVLF